MKYTCFVKNDTLSVLHYQNLVASLNANGWQYDQINPQLIITIGGDGTVLAAIHQYQHLLDRVAFVGLHTGHLGFFNDYRLEEAKDFINDLVSRQPVFEPKQLLQAVIDGDQRQKVFALNEIRIESSIKTQTLTIRIDGREFEVLRGSGICVSGQVGSTAYNRSIGGAVMDDEIIGLQLSEVNSINNSIFRSLSSPLVLNRNRNVTVEAEDFTYSMLSYDHLYYSLQGRRQVDIRLSDKAVFFARYRELAYLSRLRVLF